nr:hypothetical protein TDPV-013 [Oriental turtle dovepox virus]
MRITFSDFRSDLKTTQYSFQAHIKTEENIINILSRLSSTIHPLWI